MNMSVKNIPYKSIIMRCDCVNENAFAEVTERFSIVKYHSGMKSVWVEIQKSAGQFSDYADVAIAEYFDKTFLLENSEISERCLFLKDNVKEEYVGTCCAWFSDKDKKHIPILHWLAVVPTHRNRGCARILITETLKVFMQKYGNQAIYLHTQPSSFQAIKLYNDFGFNIAKEDSSGHAVNEYAEAMKILEKVMTLDTYEKLKDSVVK